jgi:hypothetical protein
MAARSVRSARADPIVIVESGPMRRLRSPGKSLLLSLALSLCAGALMSGCSAATKPRPSPHAGLLSILQGRLYGDPTSGCIWVGKKTVGDEVGWPRGYRIETRPLRLVQNGRVVARSGDRLRLSGGLDFRYPRSHRCAHFVERDKFAADHVLQVIRR